MNFSRSRGDKSRLGDWSVIIPGSTSISWVNWPSLLIADVGCRTVTIGFHCMPVKMGSGFPHLRHCSKPSGLAVPQEEQYTGVRIDPQSIQYLPSRLFGFRQDGQVTKVPGIVLRGIDVVFEDKTVAKDVTAKDLEELVSSRKAFDASCTSGVAYPARLHAVIKRDEEGISLSSHSLMSLWKHFRAHSSRKHP